MCALRKLAAVTAAVNATAMTLSYTIGGGLETTNFVCAWAGTAVATWAYIELGDIDLSTYRDVAMRLRWEIKEEGRWIDGTALPGHRELAARLETSRTTLRNALALLEEEGLVEVRHGYGTFVVGADVAARTALVENYIRNLARQGREVGRPESIAQAWSVSPPTVRRIINRLTVAGVIRRRRDGTFEPVA